jgi:hypothetical protein
MLVDQVLHDIAEDEAEAAGMVEISHQADRAELADGDGHLR